MLESMRVPMVVLVVLMLATPMRAQKSLSGAKHEGSRMAKEAGSALADLEAAMQRMYDKCQRVQVNG